MNHNGAIHSEVKQKGMRRRLRIVLVLLVCFIGWAAWTIWGQNDQVNAKQTTLKQMEAKLEEAMKQNEAYQNELMRLQDPEYIEQLIRKDLNMTKPDETIFIQSK